MPTREEALAYAAGFFSGEGTTRYQVFLRPTGEYCNIKFCLPNTNHKEIVRFQETMGFGVINGPYQPKAKKSHKPYWIYSANGLELVKKAVEMLSPWLSEEKLEQAEEAIEGAEEWYSNRQRVYRKTAEHGTTTMYNKGCRCNLCYLCMSDYMRERRGAKR